MNVAGVSWSCRSFLRHGQLQLQGLGALQVRSVLPAVAVARSGSVARAFCGTLEAAVAGSGSVAGASSGTSSSSSRPLVASSSSHSRAWERCRSVLWLWQQQLQSLGALQERFAAAATAVLRDSTVARVKRKDRRTTTTTTTTDGRQQHCEGSGAPPKA